MDWQIIISLITLALVIFGIIWGNGLWARRERVKIRINALDYRIQGQNEKLRVYLGGDVLRPGGKEVRLIDRIILKPNSTNYNELCKFFKLPEDGLIIFAGPINVEGDNCRVTLPSGPVDYEPRSFEVDRAEFVRDIAKKIGDAPHKVGIVWDDNGKITWKTVSLENHGKWV